ncbi:unnamed protein product [Bemisia tabaci]|uniref:Uncharacterized protein n=1 Tax=Bemisia tabaci TaxID=7038 RepID=A0A9N9ZWT5_BEMTA|nr:unnamed protein product [Bemisia tabaci]
MVLEELRKGNSAASSGDLHLKRLSVNKLTFHSSILSRIMEVTINEELKVELTRLITCTSQFLESNRITGYSMVETAPVGPGLLGTIPPSISGGRPEYVLPMGYINNCRKAGMTLAAIA